MTDPAAGRTHPSLDALADLLAGEGTAEDVRHLEGCAGCSARLDELDAATGPVTAALAALPVPPLPADLAARLDAALAAEPPLTPAPRRPAAAGPPPGETTGQTTVLPGGTVTPLPSRAPGRRWVPAVAAAAVLLAGSVAGYGLLRDGGGLSRDTAATSESAAGGAAADSALGVPRSATGQDYAADPALLAATLPALLGGDATARTPDAEGPAPVAAPPSDPALARLQDPAELAGCLSGLLPPDQPEQLPLALDDARYGGQPALVVVLPASVPDKVDVFVVGAGCRAGADETLFFTRLDRP